MPGGLLAGVTVTGVLMSIFQANAGGSWDNAKRLLKKELKLMERSTIRGQILIKCGGRGYSWGPIQGYLWSIVKYY